MDSRDTLAMETRIVEKIRNGKLRTLRRIDLMTDPIDPSATDIAKALAEVNPLSSNRRDEIIAKLCEISPAKEKQIDLKRVTWEYFLEETYKTSIYPYDGKFVCYSTMSPEYFKSVINCLDRTIFYTNGNSFTLLDIIYTVSSMNRFRDLFYNLMNSTIRIDDEKTLYHDVLHYIYPKYDQILDSRELDFIINLPQCHNGIYYYMSFYNTYIKRYKRICIYSEYHYVYYNPDSEEYTIHWDKISQQYFDITSLIKHNYKPNNYIDNYYGSDPDNYNKDYYEDNYNNDHDNPYYSSDADNYINDYDNPYYDSDQ